MKIFLSSTYQDLAEHRRLAAEALERLGQQGVRMEVFGARRVDASVVCDAGISEADAFIGLYAHSVFADSWSWLSRGTHHR